jgi:hypothetical protein
MVFTGHSRMHWEHMFSHGNPCPEKRKYNVLKMFMFNIFPPKFASF